MQLQKIEKKKHWEKPKTNVGQHKHAQQQKNPLFT
jgi:hypothetical protein